MSLAIAYALDAKGRTETDVGEHDAARFYKGAENDKASAVFGGKWESEHRGKTKMICIKFNGVQHPGAEGLKAKEVVFGSQFKLVLFEDGSLYSWGISAKGCLGLGEGRKQTNNRLERISIKEKVVQVKVGANHVLALTQEGKVYAWGDNSKGQVGKNQKIKNSNSRKPIKSKWV